MSGLNDEETLLVATVRSFIDREVRPTVREVEHADTYPQAWIEQMKRHQAHRRPPADPVRRRTLRQR